MFVARVSKSISQRCRCHTVKVALNAKAINPGTSTCWRVFPRQFTSISASLVPKSEPTDQDTTSPPKWRIVSAVIVQRMPLISQEKTPLELKYEEMIHQVWMERSKLSDFELEELKLERIKQDRIKKALDEDVTYTKAVSEDADDFEDLQESREMELQEFKAAPRITEADISGDTKSLNRKLHRVLYLLVKKPRKEHSWQMPQGGIEEDESLVEGAKREFLEECGPGVRISFYSHTPLAVLSYTHPPPSEAVGSKVFFMKARYIDGTLQLDNRELLDHVWVTKEEMRDYVSPEYYNTVEPILLE